MTKIPGYEYRQFASNKKKREVLDQMQTELDQGKRGERRSDQIESGTKEQQNVIDFKETGLLLVSAAARSNGKTGGVVGGNVITTVKDFLPTREVTFRLRSTSGTRFGFWFGT